MCIFQIKRVSAGSFRSLNDVRFISNQMSYKAMKEFQLIRPQIPQFMPQQFCSCVPGEKSLAKCINHKGFLLYLSNTGTAFGRRKERDIKQKVIYEKK